MKVVIAGCGIGGATTALALSRAGVEVAVYEQAPVLAEVGAGIGLWPNALRALATLGVADDVIALAGGLVATSLRSTDGRTLIRQSCQLMEARWGAGFVAVHRAELHALLCAALDPATVHLGTRCTGFHTRPGGVVVALDNGERVEADVLVGADGVHSVVRSALSGPAPLRYRGYTNWRGITPPGSVPPVAEATDTWGRGGHFGLQPTSGGRILWYAGLNTAAGGADDEHLHEYLLAAFGHWHEPIASVITATPAASIIRNDICDARPSRTWYRGPVVLLGDAIHPMTPDLGQGACQAIVDATTLAACLSARSDVARALEDYRRRRFRSAAAAMLFSRSWGGMAHWEGRRTCDLRDLLVRTMPTALQLRQLDQVLRA